MVSTSNQSAKKMYALSAGCWTYTTSFVVFYKHAHCDRFGLYCMSLGVASSICVIQQKGVFLSLSYLVRKVAESPKKITPGWHLMTVDWKDFCDCTLRENILYHLISSRVKMYNGYSWSCKHLQSTRIWFDCSHWNLSNQYKIHLINSLNASGVRLRTEKTVS